MNLGGKRAVVTGVSGFIGSHLAEDLLSSGWSVTGLDRRSPRLDPVSARNIGHLLTHPRFRFTTGDVTGRELDGLVSGSETVFHLAAATGVRSSWGRRFAEYAICNVLATQRLMEACVHGGVRRVVLASSSSVYGNASSGGSKEADPAEPCSPYGVSKLASERLACAYASRPASPVSVVALRYFTVYGARQREDMAIARMFRAALTGEPMRVFGDGSQRRAFTFVGDVTRATVLAAGCRAGAEVVNVAGPESVSLAQVADLIEEIIGRRVPMVRRDRQPGEVRVTDADLSRAETVLGFQPRVSLPDGLERQWKWLMACSSPGVFDDRSVS